MINPDYLESSIKKEASELNVRKVIVALSGGADSVATAFALKQCGLEVMALHCNFHLRGEESDRDTLFVTKFCSRINLPLKIKDFDVKEYQENHKGVSTEMACRELRHEWFRQQLKESGYQRIATGHNADDNIETFFLNALRGSGTRGLKGMDPDNGTIWRPLLAFHRREILEYLSANNLEFVVDSTNLQSDYRRNFLRNEIIPLLRKEWKGFDRSMDKTIRNIRRENALVEELLVKVLPAPLEPLPVSEILAASAPLLIIQRFIDPAGPFAITAEEILSAIKADKPHIRRWRLKKGVVFLRNRNLFVEMIHGESRS